ncbi:MAG TPA: SdrD B-like domain-containing protein [Candidatus Lumbricidophila sp.]|nr:SdrD B-like domain-containing protein [Candidatus Lumbricidophila sp.]
MPRIPTLSGLHSYRATRVARHAATPSPKRRLVTRVTALAVALGTAASGAAMAGVALAAPTSELSATWVSPAGTTVPNGGLVSGETRVNANDTQGADGQIQNAVVTVALTNAGFTGIPSACKTTGVSPVSSLSADRGTLTCNLGDLTYGTSAVVQWTAAADGSNGDLITPTITGPLGATVTMPSKTIQATSEIDVIANASYLTSQDKRGAWTASFPVALTLPVGAQRLTGPISFDLTVTNNTMTNASTAIELASDTCYNITGNNLATIPRSGAGDPVPTTCSVVQTSPGVFHVVVDGYTISPGAAPRVSSTNAPLRSDRVYFSAFAFKMRNSSPLTPLPSAFTTTVSNVSATGADGTTITTDADTSNDSATWTVVPPGNVSSSYDRGSWSGFGMQNDATGVGAAWDGNAVVTPSSYLIPQVDNVMYWGTDSSTVAAGRNLQSCVILDGPGAFTGKLTLVNRSEAYPIAATVGINNVHISYATDPAPSGSRDDTDCRTLALTPTTAAVTFTGTVGAGEGRGETIVTGTPPAGANAMLITIPISSWPTGTPLPRYQFRPEVQMSASAPIGSELWELGSTENTSGNMWTAGLSGIITATPGGTYAGTSGMSDRAVAIGGYPDTKKTVSAAQAATGQTVTYTLTTANTTNSASPGTASWTLTDTLPAGLEYTSGSASLAPASVTANSDGTTTLVWNITRARNSPLTITYDAKVTAANGTLTNTVEADSPDFGPNFTPTTANRGAAKASVAVANSGTTVLDKTSESPTFAAGSGNAWDLTIENRDTVDQQITDLIDVLPYNGDGRGTAFTGTYEITNVIAAAGDTVYYTTVPPATIDTDPASAQNGALGSPSAMWSTTKPAPGTVITGIRIVGGVLPVGASKTDVIQYEVTGGAVGDKFVNIAWAKADHTALQMIRQATATTVPDGSTLKIHKELVNNGGWASGSLWTYLVTIKNDSSKVAYDVTTHDVSGYGFDPASVSLTAPSQGSVDANGVWQVGDLAPGAVATITVNATVNVAGYPTSDFKNSAYVTNPSHPFSTDLATGQPTSCAQNPQSVDDDVDQCDFVVTAPPTGQIGDYVWFDVNHDGVQDASEQPVAGFPVRLTGTDGLGDPVDVTTTTDAAGKYLFDQVKAGTYTVTFPATGLQEGQDFTTPSTIAIVLGIGESRDDADAGIIPQGTASIGDYVWYDLNKDGKQDATEQPVAGFPVKLTGTDEIGKQITLTATTDAAGHYVFDKLRAGDYTVTMDAAGLKSGESFTTPAEFNVPLATDEHYVDADSGIAPAAVSTIGDYVWYDLNKDGKQDATEQPVAGFPVKLTGTDAAGNAVSLTTTTDASGHYLFDKLYAGVYHVEFDTAELQAGESFTTKHEFDVSIANNQQYLDADAGIAKPGTGSIGDYVWLDANKDGKQDSTEKPVSGVHVKLAGTDAAGNAVELTTTTDATGHYVFEHLYPGDYTVTFDKADLKPGEEFTTPNTLQVKLAEAQQYVDADAGIAPAPVPAAAPAPIVLTGEEIHEGVNPWLIGAGATMFLIGVLAGFLYNIRRKNDME